MICTNCGNSVDQVNRFCPRCGAPMQSQASPPQSGDSPYSPPDYRPPPMMAGQAPPKKSGCGKWILIAVVILVLLGAIIGGILYFGFRYAENKLKSSEAYAVAIKTLKEDEQVKEKLGEIQDTGFPFGVFNEDGDGSGKAAFVVGVEGTKGKAQYQVALTRSGGLWHVDSGVVKTASGETIRVGSPLLPRVVASDGNENLAPVDPKAKNFISGGVLNGKAISLPKPVFPPLARQAHASGTVVVQVLVDENGNVVSAKAISGHPPLQSAAVVAARQAKFAPTKLSGKSVKVSGVLQYTFTAE
jgi:TonB family protein